MAWEKQHMYFCNVIVMNNLRFTIHVPIMRFKLIIQRLNEF